MLLQESCDRGGDRVRGAEVPIVVGQAGDWAGELISEDAFHRSTFIFQSYRGSKSTETFVNGHKRDRESASMVKGDEGPIGEQKWPIREHLLFFISAGKS